MGRDFYMVRRLKKLCADLFEGKRAEGDGSGLRAVSFSKLEVVCRLFCGLHARKIPLE